MSAAIPQQKVVAKLIRKSDKIPAKVDPREELRRLADLTLTISKRIRQLEDALVIK